MIWAFLDYNGAPGGCTVYHAWMSVSKGPNEGKTLAITASISCIQCTAAFSSRTLLSILFTMSLSRVFLLTFPRPQAKKASTRWLFWTLPSFTQCQAGLLVATCPVHQRHHLYSGMQPKKPCSTCTTLHQYIAMVRQSVEIVQRSFISPLATNMVKASNPVFLLRKASSNSEAVFPFVWWQNILAIF